MSPTPDLRRRPETPPAFGDAFPAGLRSEAFAEDVADLLVPAPAPLTVAPLATPSTAMADVPRPWFGRLNLTPPALGA